jgi:putative glutamine amidotransferase
MRPVIGITPDVGETSARPGRPALPRYELKQAYADAVLAAGGLPVVLPYSDDDGAPQEAIELCDGLVITGGAFDIPPELYGAEAGQKLGPLKRGRTAYEQRVLRAALAADLPVLGICGGMQCRGGRAARSGTSCRKCRAPPITGRGRSASQPRRERHPRQRR